MVKKLCLVSDFKIDNLPLSLSFPLTHGTHCVVGGTIKGRPPALSTATRVSASGAEVVGGVEGGVVKWVVVMLQGGRSDGGGGGGGRGGLTPIVLLVLGSLRSADWAERRSSNVMGGR